jgi:hypothetical protein
MMKTRFNLEIQRTNNGTFDIILRFVDKKCVDVAFQSYFNRNHPWCTNHIRRKWCTNFGILNLGDGEGAIAHLMSNNGSKTLGFLTRLCIWFEELFKVDAQLSVSLLWRNGVFFLELFIQMHMVINISLDLLIGTWI